MWSPSGPPCADGERSAGYGGGFAALLGCVPAKWVSMNLARVSSVVKYITSAVSDASFMPVQALPPPIVAAGMRFAWDEGGLHCRRYLFNICTSPVDDSEPSEPTAQPLGTFLSSAIGALAFVDIFVPLLSTASTTGAGPRMACSSG